MKLGAGCDICSASVLQEQVRALNDLIDVARASVSTIELDALLEAILESAMRFTGLPAGSVALYDNRTGNLTLRAQRGLSPEFVARRSWVVAPGGLTDQLLQHDEILFVEDTQQVDFFNNPLALKEGIRSLICIPLVIKDCIHGVLYLDDFVPRRFDKDRMKLISVLASFAAMAIENAKLHHATCQMAITDALTGLYNRRYFEQVLPQELERARRYKQSFGLLMIDVDNFKNFNDAFGHPMGDRILVTIAKTIEKALRNVDFAFRYGGEELAVILPETSLKSASQIAERIRQRVIADTRKLMRTTSKEPITVSVGVACFPVDGADADKLVVAADDLLYQAKAAGKNCVRSREVDPQ
ncbi:MAG: sensor domain-containing diguanylate cyclase [Geobacteraceae bacterium]|nr:sensor domain-containing diguanylate cyclase [Geobacteraceae bacterium]